MVGIAGALGDGELDDPTLLADALCFFGDEVPVEYTADNGYITTVFHDLNTEPQPVTLQSPDTHLWVWGNLYGYYPGAGTYHSKEQTAPSLTNAEYCGKLFDEHGWQFIAGLNGSFAGIVLDEKSNTLSIYTDRLGSRPIHYGFVDGVLVFSSQIQSLGAYLKDSLSFDMDYLTEYFTFERSLGLKTPIAGVQRAHPGAVTHIDVQTGSAELDVQWRPVHTPADRSFTSFASQFAKLFDAAVAERYDPTETSGVLLSGGSDSRLIMGALPKENVTGYHINDWWNREARLASEIADRSGKPFEFLERGNGYYQSFLDFTSRVSNYTSWFQHGHTAGFAETLRRKNDVLITGHYSDTLFKHNYLPYRGIIMPGTNIELPLYFERVTASVEDLVSMYLGTKFHNRKHLRMPPAYLRGGNIRTILEKNITATPAGVNHHGVLHHSPYDAGLFSEAYPLTNTAGRLFFDVMLQAAPFRDPFLDVRLIDLMTHLPVAYRLRKNIINAAISQIQPDLAQIPHPDTNIALKHPFALHYIALQLNWIADQFRETSNPKSYYTQGSWPNWDELVRHHDLIQPMLREHEELLQTVEWVDMDRFRREYENHMAGKNRFDELSSLLSFVTMPITQTILSTEGAKEVGQLPRTD